MTEEIIKISTKQSKDDIQFQKLISNFALLAKHIRKDLNSSQQVSYTFHKNFNKDDVMTWMANPAKYIKQLRNLSRFLYDTSSHYKRLIQYFATMLTYDHIVEPYGMTEFKPDKNTIETIQKKYINTINYLEVMNLKHEFAKLSERAWIDDIAYGYEYRLKDSYFLDTLNPDYCEVTGIEDGTLTFAFNFQYFDTYKEELKRFSQEFQDKYEEYKKDRKNKKWQELDTSKTICIKINENIDYPIPPFCGVFEELYSIEDYKQLKLAKTELENYLLLNATIPYKKDATEENAFALSLDKAIEYFDLMAGSLPDQVGAILSPFESVEAIKLERTDKTTDTVEEAEASLYNSAGVSQLLFNSKGATGAALTKSILADQTVCFKVLRQFERWINKKLKDENKIIKFRTNFLDITKYNQSDFVGLLKDAATLGLPCKLQYCAAIGMSPSSVMNMTLLENDVLGIVDKFKPLQSAYQTNVNDKGGNPGLNEDDLTGGGQDAIDRDTNNPDNRNV